MSNGTPPIQPAPSPPSVPGIPQPVFGSGSATVPATPIPITGTPILPPPLISNPPGVPPFPPTGSNTAPVPVPVGPLVGPAVGPAPAPPSVPGVQQPQFATGTGTVPPGYFPFFSTVSPSPPIVVPNIFRVGAIPPRLPETPPATGLIAISPVPTIPQMPWNPPSTAPPQPPVNTVLPTISLVGGTGAAGSTLATNAGTWNAGSGGPPTYTRQWHTDGFPITGATGVSYVTQTSDIGNLITCVVTATNSGGSASATSAPFGPITEPAGDDPEARLDDNGGAPPPVRHGGGSGSLPPRPRTTSRKKR